MTGIVIALLTVGSIAVTLHPVLSLPKADRSPLDPYQQELDRVLRQSPTGTPMCTGQRDCLPTDFPVVSSPQTDLVSCSDGRCVCDVCFITNHDENRCYICSDYTYNTTANRCGADRRPSQKQTVLYSLFLSSVGAANFYIGNIGLGIGQLIVTILFLLAVYVMICPCCVCCGLMDKEGACKGTCLFLFLFVVSIAAVVVFGLMIIGWWITDLSVFLQNQRAAPSGCFLRPDFF